MTPSRSDLAAVFDEVEQTGSCSPAAVELLLQWYDDRSGGPAALATWVERPLSTEFSPAEMEGTLPETRIDELLAGSPPSPAEVRLWQELRMNRAKVDDGDELHSVFAWMLEDSQGRERLLAVLHRDPYTVKRVLGLFVSLDEIAAALPADGELTWLS
jgi:hypothetical protein